MCTRAWAKIPLYIGKKILVGCVCGENITHYCHTSCYMQNWTCRRPHDVLRTLPSLITQHRVPIYHEGISLSDALIFKSDLLSSFTMKSYFCPRFQVGLLIIPLNKFLLPLPPLITPSLSSIFLKPTPSLVHLIKVKSCPQPQPIPTTTGLPPVKSCPIASFLVITSRRFLTLSSRLDRLLTLSSRLYCFLTLSAPLYYDFGCNFMSDRFITLSARL